VTSPPWYQALSLSIEIEFGPLELQILEYGTGVEEGTYFFKLD